MALKDIAGIGMSALRHHITGRKFPLNIMWRITDRCNYRCSYCNISTRGKKEISTGQALSLVDQMHMLGTKRIGIVGGEAILRDDFPVIMQRIKDKGIYATLVTNGSLVSRRLHLLDNVGCVIVSFDGRKENHDKNRVPGSFDEALSCLKTLSGKGINVMTNTVLSRHNLMDIPYVLKTAKDLGIKATFNLLQGRSDDYPENEEYRKALEVILDMKKKGYPVVLSASSIIFLMRWRDYRIFKTEEETPGYRCYAGELIYNIDTDGTIAPCDILSNVWKDNPDCISLGLSEAITRIPDRKCTACTCTHVIEYNHIFSFHPKTIAGWLPIMLKKSR